MAGGDYEPARDDDQRRRGRATWPWRSTRWPPTSRPRTRSGDGSSRRCPTSCAPRWPRSARCWRTSSTGSSAPDDETLRAALRQSERLSALVADLLDLSRLDAGVAPAGRHRRAGRRPARGDRRRETLRLPAPVRVRYQTSPPDLTVAGDPARLTQLVVNLVDNAIRHSPVDGEVLVSARAVEAVHLVARGPRRGTGLPRGGRGARLRAVRLRGRLGRRHRPRTGHRQMGVRAARRDDRRPADRRRRRRAAARDPAPPRPIPIQPSPPRRSRP